MNAFGEKLKEIRKRDGLTLNETAEQFGILTSTYSNVERGTSPPQSPTAKKILESDALDAKDKKTLTRLAKAKPKKVVAEVTEDDRAAYRKRKNEKYFENRAETKRVGNDKVMRAVSKSAVQRVFY